MLLVYRIDRLARRIDDLVDLLGDFEHAGVAVHSATEPFDTAIPSDLALVRMFAAVARHAS